MSGTRPFAVVTGGGTGGHVSPALAVAEALVEAGHPRSSIEFVGGRRGMEGRLVPAEGFALVQLPGRGIQRRLTAENLGSALGITAAIGMALWLAVRRRPSVVVTVGGYAGLPFAIAAVLLRIPLVVVNVDAVPGAANRLVGRFASVNAVAFPSTPLPRSTVTGPPVRRRVLDATRSSEATTTTRGRLGIGEGRQLVVVTGGSLGAGSVNRATIELGRRWSDRGDLAIYHVAGERNLIEIGSEAVAAGLGATGEGLEYHVVGFDPELPLAIAAADVVIARAGASTVAELAAIGVPSILVPLPSAPGDHQSMNARAMQRAGAAVMVPDHECSGERLATELGQLLPELATLRAMEAAARGLGHRDAAHQVARLAEQATNAARMRSR